jgi:hypothetical protein
LWATRAQAVTTPYNTQPTAVVANNGALLWNDQFASDIAFDQSEYDISPQVIFVADFCYSGGFGTALFNNTNTTFAATAANWDETSTSAPSSPLTLNLPFNFTLTIPGIFVQNADVLPFGQTFMTSAKTMNLGNSFAAASAAVANDQTAEEWVVGNAANQTLAYNAGDQAIIFSAGDANNAGLQTSFSQDVQTTYNALVARGWNANAINTMWDQGQNIPAQGGNVAVPVKSASTIGNLEAAINNAYSSGSLGDNNKLFVYLNDHGTSTDQVLSKVTPNGNGTYHYSYQVTVSSYRVNTPNPSSDFGVPIVTIGSGVPADALENISTGSLPAGWSLEVNANNDLVISATDESDSSTWLVAGQPYTFSYDSVFPPDKDNWVTEFYSTEDADLALSDFGVDDGTAWGSGDSVYNVNTPTGQLANGMDIFADPAQVLGWDNGGDGWVEAPQVPEPASFAMLGAGGLLMLCRHRRRA